MLNNSITILFVLLALFLIAKAFINPLLTKQHKQIEKLRPFVFIKMFSNALTIVFLPRYFLHLAHLSNLPPFISSLTYITYQAIFVLMLIPGGYLVEVKNIKRILFITGALQVVVLLGFGLAHHIWEIFLLQAIFGFIVPISSSAEYAYIVQSSSHENRNIAMALFSNSLKGALISGIILGGLSVAHFGGRNTFFISAIISIAACFYLLVFVPNLRSKTTILARAGSINFKLVLKGLPKALLNREFLSVLSCVGIPLGFIHEGVVFYSFPLLLGKFHFSHTTAGQLLVLFSLGFFATNKLIAKKADGKCSEKLFLIFGLFGTALALLFIAGISLAKIGLITFALGIFALGLFRGFLFSPSNAYITKHAITQKIGKNVALSSHRLAQTVGSVIGPLIMGGFFFATKNSLIIYIVLAVIFCLLAFILIKDKKINYEKNYV